MPKPALSALVVDLGMASCMRSETLTDWARACVKATVRSRAIEATLEMRLIACGTMRISVTRQVIIHRCSVERCLLQELLSKVQQLVK